MNPFLIVKLTISFLDPTKQKPEEWGCDSQPPIHQTRSRIGARETTEDGWRANGTSPSRPQDSKGRARVIPDHRGILPLVMNPFHLIPEPNMSKNGCQKKWLVSTSSSDICTTSNTDKLTFKLHPLIDQYKTTWGMHGTARRVESTFHD